MSRLKKRFHNQCSSTIPRVNNSQVSTPKPKEEKGSGPHVKKSTFSNCGKNMMARV